MKNSVVLAILSLSILVCVFPQMTNGASLELTLNVDEVIVNRDSEVVSLENYGYLREAGAPRLPARIHAVAIPPGAVFQSVTVTTDRTTTLENVTITPAQPAREIRNSSVEMDPETKKLYDATHQRVYSSNDLYPAMVAEVVRTGGFRKYNIVDIRVCPIQYAPASKTLTVHQDITLTVNYIMPETPTQPIMDNSSRMETRAADIITNYRQAQTWYPQQDNVRGLHDYVIITTSSLTGAVSTLAQWEMIKGRNVEIVTTDWIYANYTGYDNAEKIRNFLRDKYPSEQWGIEDVCIVGNMASVPMRHIYDDPDTDFYYAELSLPDSQSWDANGNHSYLGSGDSCDFYAEINIGRIPWSDSATVMSICEKTVNYEMTDDPTFKQNILLLGAYFWSDTDNAVLMEAKVDQPWMTDWTMTRMYEQNADYYSTYPCDQELLQANAVPEWANGTYAFVNYAGHGSPTSCHIYGIGAPAFIDSADCASLNDNYPAIVFADACSNSDTQEISIGASMLEQGAVGFVGATRVAYGCPGWAGPNDGSSQSLDYFFTTCCTSGDYTQGEALQYGLYEVYQMNGWNYDALEICEWTLYGNPNLGMAAVNSSDGRIMFNAENYGVNTAAVIDVRDLDLNMDPGTVESVVITVETSAGDNESLTLYETDVNTGVFNGSINLVQGSPSPGNGQLEVDHGQTITSTYIDADDGLGGVNVPKTDTAMVDLQEPVISNVTVTSITHESAIVTWTTDEPTSSMVMYGEGVPGTSEYMETLTTDHLITLTGLTDCTSFNFYVECTDEAGNTCMDDNGGGYYDFLTWEQVSYFSDDVENGEGDWTYDGLWHIVTGSSSCNEAHSPTCSWYYGQESSCDYDTGSTNSGTLTSGIIDLTTTSQAELHLWYWADIESSSTYDTMAISAQIVGGSSTTLFTLENSTTDWTELVADLGPVCGNQIQLVCFFDTYDSYMNDYQGIYVDDIEVFAAAPCEEPCVNDGDVTLDGTVTSGDAQMAFMVALGMHTPSEEEECAADCNGNGEVTAGDAQAIFMKALGSGVCAD